MIGVIEVRNSFKNAVKNMEDRPALGTLLCGNSFSKETLGTMLRDTSFLRLCQKHVFQTFPIIFLGDPHTNSPAKK